MLGVEGSGFRVYGVVLFLTLVQSSLASVKSCAVEFQAANFVEQPCGAGESEPLSFPASCPNPRSESV